MQVDISPLVQAAVGLAAASLSIFGGVALTALTRRFNVQTSAGQAALYETALSKAITFGVTQLQGTIKARGWDHIETQNQVVDTALTYIVAREPAALAAVGLTPSMDDEHSREVLTQALQRALPSAYAAAAASPATPPAPPASAPQAVAVVADTAHPAATP